MLARVTVSCVLGIAAAHAQPRSALTGDIPFEFTVGKMLLPAGSYQFTAKSGTPWLSVSGAKRGPMNVPIITRLGGSPDLRDATLVFDSFEGRRVLSEVWIPGEGGLLLHTTPKGHTHETVVAVQSGLSAGLSGKAVFERTCARCHGPNGNGNEAADKFFQTTVPRLNSEYVQKKSDAELTEIITQGRRKMDPVRVGQSTVQHLLPTESVGAVIAYVRTFKKP
jgi:mono/diheme cytochrome c family protein